MFFQSGSDGLAGGEWAPERCISASIFRLFCSFIEAVQMIHRKPEKAIAVAQHVFPDLDRDVVENAVLRMITSGTFPQHIAIPDQAWQALISIRLSVGDLKEPQKTSVAVDNRFAETAQTILE